MAVGAWAEVAMGRRFWGEVLHGLLLGVQWERWLKGFVVSCLPASSHFLSTLSGLLALKELV